MDELKACCPWCNSELAVTYEEDRVYKAVCAHCGKTVTFEDKSYYGALDTLNRRSEPENKPLSLEELRRMDGEPVYLKTNTSRGNFYALVKHINLQEGKALFSFDCCGWQAYTDDYEKSWTAYAHKPEQEENL